MFVEMGSVRTISAFCTCTIKIVITLFSQLMHLDTVDSVGYTSSLIIGMS